MTNVDVLKPNFTTRIKFNEVYIARILYTFIPVFGYFKNWI